MKFQKIFLVVVLVATVLYGNRMLDTSVTWFAFNEAWSIAAEKENNLIRYSDLKRRRLAIMNLFCRSLLENENQIAFKLQITEVIDSVYFGVSFKSGR